jgi:hypothetical protein
MAQLIQCDAHNMEHPADWLVTRMADGEVLAYCDAGYFAFMTDAVNAAAEAEAQATDAEAVARLEAAVAADKATTEPAGAPLVLEGAPEGGNVIPATEPARVVKRGQSARAIAHREKIAAATMITALAPTVTVMPPDPGDDDEDDDEDAAAPPA